MSVMTAGTASVLRFAAMLLAAFLLGVPSAWGALALWYQAPGSLLKRLIVLLWSAFALGVVIALWQGHAAPANVCTSAETFGTPMPVQRSKPVPAL